MDAQEADCQAWVEDHGHRLAGVYNDAGLSARAKYTKRREMLRLLDDVRSGKIDLIVFTKLDRWFRNVADYYEVQSILEARDVRWRAIQEDYETETASGRFKVNIMLAVAQDEADRTSERIKAAADYKRSKGEAVGRPALGYRITDRHWTIDPETQPALEAFFRSYLATMSVRSAMAAAAEHGLRLNATHAGRILRNPTYKGDAFGVPCPAYITEDQFRLIRSHAGKRTRTNRTGRVFLFSGLLRCGHCGGAMTSAASPSKTKTVKYYRCMNHNHELNSCPSGSYANEEKLECFLTENLSDMAARYNAQSVSPQEEDRIRRDIERTLGKLDRLKELYIEGDIDRPAYDLRHAALADELEDLRVRIPEEKKPVDLPPDWAETYITLPDAYKKVFWHKTVRKIECFRDQSPRVYF